MTNPVEEEAYRSQRRIIFAVTVAAIIVLPIPAGQLQVATALDMTDMLETRLDELRHHGPPRVSWRL